MKKRVTSILALGLSAVLLLSQAGCGSSTGEKESGAASAPQGETSGESEGGKEAVSAEAGSIAYPLNSDKKVRWYAQDNIVPHENLPMHPSHRSISGWQKSWEWT